MHHDIIPTIPQGLDAPLTHALHWDTWHTIGRVGDIGIKITLTIPEDANIDTIRVSVHATDLTEPINSDLLTRVQRATTPQEYQRLLDEIAGWGSPDLDRLALAVADAHNLIQTALRGRIHRQTTAVQDLVEVSGEAFAQLVQDANPEQPLSFLDCAEDLDSVAAEVRADAQAEADADAATMADEGQDA